MLLCKSVWGEVIVSAATGGSGRLDEKNKKKIEEISNRVDLGRIERSRLCSLPATRSKRRAPVYAFPMHRSHSEMVMRNLLPFQEAQKREKRSDICSSVL